MLSQLPNATIYIEAGASDWESAALTAKKLKRVGVSKVRGFMLNVTHTDWTRNNIKHGLAISKRIGGKPFIINTAANGRGSILVKKNPRKASRKIHVWCNPPLRGIGKSPTTQTSHPKVDAYVWISRPGFSMGACNGGPLPSGAWWPERALELVRNRTDWESAPAGTRYGWSKKLTRKQLGVPAQYR